MRAIIRSRDKNYKPLAPGQEEPARDFAFAKCRSGHIVGLIIDRRFYITSVSQVKLMLPSGHYETWDSRWWAPGYPEIVKLQGKTIYLRN